jgi:branched-chain amino acid transport system permease protein
MRQSESRGSTSLSSGSACAVTARADRPSATTRSAACPVTQFLPICRQRASYAGPDSRGVQLDSQFDSYELGPLVFDAVRLHAAIAAVAIAGLLWLFFTRTRTGKSIRAAADNNMGALVVGLDVRRLYAFTFGVGAACVGAAGALMITIIPVTPFLAVEYTLLAFVIVIVGGLGSMTGALMGGLLIGVSEAVAGLLLQPSLKSMFSFGLLILVLLLRPQGLFGKKAEGLTARE